MREFLSIQTSLHNLPPYVTRDVGQAAERQREKEIARERLARLVDGSPAIRAHLTRALEHFNGVVGEPASFAPLHDLLERQAYRLAYWRTAFDEINYRRFFDVNELAGLRTEHLPVFADTHALVHRLLRRGVVRGLRVDHPDGLFDPRQYFERLRSLTESDDLDHASDAAPKAHGSAAATPKAAIYIVIEKILTSGESLPKEWPIDGATGYDFLNVVNGVFVDPAGWQALRRTHARVTRMDVLFADLVYECKKLIMTSSLASELNVLAHMLNRLSEASWRTRDFTLNSCRKALIEVIAGLSVYRTYITESSTGAQDQQAVADAIRRARRRNPVMEPTIYDFLEHVMLPHDRPSPSGVEGLSRDARLDFARRLQQYTGPVHAKGVEDTAFYRYHVLTSLNEVGGDPGRAVAGPQEFHAHNQERLRERPREMIATATHDTKRGEDLRARLNVLSEIPDVWRRAVGQWMRINARHRGVVEGHPAPSRSDEYLFYQTLVAVWPLDENLPGDCAPAALVERLVAFMQKAGREAKVHSSWININQPYEAAVEKFVRETLTSSSFSRFRAALLPVHRLVAEGGMVNGLAQLALKLAAPGVPDMYQGTELWDLSLVDPDNRRPVDFDHRKQLLADLEPVLTYSGRDPSSVPPQDLQARTTASLVEHWRDGRLKLYLAARGLRLRREYPTLFVEGEYLPLAADGAGQDHVVAFARRQGANVLIVVVPRLTRRLLAPGRHLPLGVETWGATRLRLPESLSGFGFRDLMTGDLLEPVGSGGALGLPVAQILRVCPVAWLWADPKLRATNHRCSNISSNGGDTDLASVHVRLILSAPQTTRAPNDLDVLGKRASVRRSQNA